MSIRSILVVTATLMQLKCAGQLPSASWLTGYLLREIQKANIAVPEEDESPLAPPPRQVLEIMVSARLDFSS